MILGGPEEHMGRDRATERQRKMDGIRAEGEGPQPGKENAVL